MEARPAKRAIPRTGRVVLVRKVVVGARRAKITVKPSTIVRVVKTATTVKVRTKKAPKGQGVLRVVASGSGVTPVVWNRAWNVR